MAEEARLDPVKGRRHSSSFVSFTAFSLLFHQRVKAPIHSPPISAVRFSHAPVSFRSAIVDYWLRLRGSQPRSWAGLLIRRTQKEAVMRRFAGKALTLTVLSCSVLTAAMAG